ncbi:MAG: hypothetical protein ACOX5R_07230 [bacterium]
MHDAAISNKSGKIFYAMDSENRIHSSLFLIWDSESSYVHMIGEDPQLRNSGAGILLIWKAIEYTSKVLNLHKFDFEGSMIESVEQVRRDFGATQVPYFTVNKMSPRAKLLFPIYQFIVKVSR